MSGFFSRSSSKGCYPYSGYGGKYYKRRGILSGLFGRHSTRKCSGHPPYNQQGCQHQEQSIRRNQYNSSNLEKDSLGKCLVCAVSIPIGSKFCLSCGEPVSNLLSCPYCGRGIPASCTFCPECGQRV